MENTQLKEMYEEANSDLQKAVSELNRPAEDVVNYSGCVYARKALYGFANCLYHIYADQQNEPLKENLTLEELIAYSSQFDPDIARVDFSCVHCRDKDLSHDFDEVFYCDDVNKVNSCKELAEKVRSHLLDQAEAEMFQDS